MKTTKLGKFLKYHRSQACMSLRAVEAKTKKKVGNAYLSQIERGVIKAPHPQILRALSNAIGFRFMDAMRAADYLTKKDF